MEKKKKKTELDTLLDYFLKRCPIDSMQIVKDEKQTDVYKIVFSDTSMEYAVKKADLDYFCDRLYENHESECVKSKDSGKFTKKTLTLLKIFLNPDCQ